MSILSLALDIRVEWARTRVLEISEGALDERVADGYADAYEAAYALGTLAAHQDEPFAPPHLFADVKDLRTGWKRGYVDQQELAEMMRCPGCNNGTGDPCCIHG